MTFLHHQQYHHDDTIAPSNSNQIQNTTPQHSIPLQRLNTQLTSVLINIIRKWWTKYGLNKVEMINRYKTTSSIGRATPKSLESAQPRTSTRKLTNKSCVNKHLWASLESQCSFFKLKSNEKNRCFILETKTVFIQGTMIELTLGLKRLYLPNVVSHDQIIAHLLVILNWFLIEMWH